jgi:hypothetical protein
VDLGVRGREEEGRLALPPLSPSDGIREGEGRGERGGEGRKCVAASSSVAAAALLPSSKSTEEILAGRKSLFSSVIVIVYSCIEIRVYIYNYISRTGFIYFRTKRLPYRI